MKAYLTTAAILLMTGIATAGETSAKFVEHLRAGTPQKIVFYGTSLTRRGPWVEQVQAALDAKFPKLCTFANGAKSGEHSKWGLENVQDHVVAEKPDVVFIEFTTNDAVDRFHISPDDARANLKGIIDAIHKDRPDCEIILQTMNPVIRPKTDPGYRSDLPAYWKMYRQFAKDTGTLLIDHSPAFEAELAKGEAEYKKLVPDGTHPNSTACQQITTPEILKAIGVEASAK